jgi:hypothetical protein
MDFSFSSLQIGSLQILYIKDTSLTGLIPQEVRPISHKAGLQNLRDEMALASCVIAIPFLEYV